MKKRKLGLATQYIIIVCALLLALNVVLGVILIRQSGGSMNTLIRWHMLSVADMAAASLDGDMLEALTENDVGSPEFRQIEDTLTTVINTQRGSDIKYIYATKKQGDHFVFTVDPDPVSPGAFGEEVVYTPAQDVAWGGVGAVDDKTYNDKWGSFYTAWSPVRNSAGKVIGLVGVDFVADWYDEQVAAHTRVVIIFSSLSVVVGGAIMLLLAGQLRRRMRALNAELAVLSDEVEELSNEIRVSPGGDEKPQEEEPPSGSDLIGTLAGRMGIMQRKLKAYMEYAQQQAYTDSMTGVGNKTAYLEHIRELNRGISDGTADFGIAVFDLNGLKTINDNFGHECGDRVITDAAMAILRVFAEGKTFRIGGDEFIVVLEKTTEEALEGLFKQLFAAVEDFNKNEKRYAMTLSLSGGGAVYRPGEDADFKEVFKRADEAMYRSKDEYYHLHCKRRRQYDDDEN